MVMAIKNKLPKEDATRALRRRCIVATALYILHIPIKLERHATQCVETARVDGTRAYRTRSQETERVRVLSYDDLAATQKRRSGDGCCAATTKRQRKSAVVFII